MCFRMSSVFKEHVAVADYLLRWKQRYKSHQMLAHMLHPTFYDLLLRGISTSVEASCFGVPQRSPFQRHLRGVQLVDLTPGQRQCAVGENP
jgi:hypothetical protein